MSVFRPLPLSFYRRPAEEVARDLLGRWLVREFAGEPGERLILRLVETEAYLGAPDRASHAWGGRRTPRNESLYLPGGHAYVYFIYGMHFCLNVVTEGTDLHVLPDVHGSLDHRGRMDAGALADEDPVAAQMDVRLQGDPDVAGRQGRENGVQRLAQQRPGGRGVIVGDEGLRQLREELGYHGREVWARNRFGSHLGIVLHQLCVIEFR